MECYCFLRNVQDLLADGEIPYERRFEEPFERPEIPLTDFCTRPVKAPPIWQESFTWNIHRKNTIRGGNLERIFSGCRH